jgi:hypothetical protein
MRICVRGNCASNRIAKWQLCWPHNMHVMKDLEEGRHYKFLPELAVPKWKVLSCLLIRIRSSGNEKILCQPSLNVVTHIVSWFIRYHQDQTVAPYCTFLHIRTLHLTCVLACLAVSCTDLTVLFVIWCPVPFSPRHFLLFPLDCCVYNVKNQQDTCSTVTVVSVCSYKFTL